MVYGGLREAIGPPYGLAICIDAGQAVMARVQQAFPPAEHRECMFHLVYNFKKGIVARCLMSTYGQRLSLLIYLTSIGKQWMKLDQMP
jgi:hypothetical protein